MFHKRWRLLFSRDQASQPNLIQFIDLIFNDVTTTYDGEMCGAFTFDGGARSGSARSGRRFVAGDDRDGWFGLGDALFGDSVDDLAFWKTVPLRTHTIVAPYVDSDLQNRWCDLV